MKCPDAANTGAFARNLVSGTDQKVAQSPSDINVHFPDRWREFPILARHWFGLKTEAQHETA